MSLNERPGAMNEAQLCNGSRIAPPTMATSRVKRESVPHCRPRAETQVRGAIRATSFRVAGLLRGRRAWPPNTPRSKPSYCFPPTRQTPVQGRTPDQDGIAVSCVGNCERFHLCLHPMRLREHSTIRRFVLSWAAHIPTDAVSQPRVRPAVVGVRSLAARPPGVGARPLVVVAPRLLVLALAPAIRLPAVSQYHAAVLGV